MYDTLKVTGEQLSMDRIRIGYPAGYLRFLGSGLDLDIHF